LIKQDPAIKQEIGRECFGNEPGLTRSNARQRNQVAIANEKMAIDLTEDSDSDDDEIEILAVATVGEPRASPDSGRTVEGGDEATTDIEVVEIPTADSSTPAMSQDMVEVGDMVGSVAAVNESMTATETPETATQPAPKDVAPSGDDDGSDIEILEVREAKRRKTGGFGDSIVKTEPFLLPSIMA
jgi:hypothetical protein